MKSRIAKKTLKKIFQGIECSSAGIFIPAEVLYRVPKNVFESMRFEEETYTWFPGGYNTNTGCKQSHNSYWIKGGWISAKAEGLLSFSQVRLLNRGRIAHQNFSPVFTYDRD